MAEALHLATFLGKSFQDVCLPLLKPPAQAPPPRDRREKWVPGKLVGRLVAWLDFDGCRRITIGLRWLLWFQPHSSLLQIMIWDDRVGFQIHIFWDGVKPLICNVPLGPYPAGRE